MIAWDGIQRTAKPLPQKVRPRITAGPDLDRRATQADYIVSAALGLSCGAAHNQPVLGDPSRIPAFQGRLTDSTYKAAHLPIRCHHLCSAIDRTTTA